MNTCVDGPLISVVIATYNVEHEIEACLQSVLAQSLGDFEICVMDGLSRDATAERVRAMAARDKRIRLKSEVDHGVYDAMNKGVAIARGRWIFFLGSDDRLAHRDVFAELAPHLDTTRVDFVHGDIVWRNDGWGRDGQVYGGAFSTADIVEKNFCHQAIFYARTVFERFKGYRTEYRVLADWEFNLRVFNGVRRQYVPVLIAEVYGGGLSQRAFDYAFDRDFVSLASSALGLKPGSEAFRHRNNRIKQTFKSHFRARRFRLGWRYLRIWLADEDSSVFTAIVLRRLKLKRSDGAAKS